MNLTYIKGKQSLLRTLLLLLISSALYGQDTSSSQNNVLNGYLILESEPSGITVYLDNRVLGRTPLPVKSVTSGEHRIIFFHQKFENATFDIHVQPDDTVRLIARLKQRSGLISIQLNDPGNDVQIHLDGRYIPSDSLERIPSASGVHALEVYSPQSVRLVQKDIYSVASEHIVYNVNIDALNYFPMLLNVGIPGIGQFQCGEMVKGGVFAAAALTTAYLLLDANKEYSYALEDYDAAKSDYDTKIRVTTSPSVVRMYRENVQSSYGTMTSAFDLRSKYFYLYVGIVLLSELDIVLNYPTIHTVSIELKQPVETMFPGISGTSLMPQLELKYIF